MQARPVNDAGAVEPWFANAAVSSLDIVAMLISASMTSLRARGRVTLPLALLAAVPALASAPKIGVLNLTAGPGVSPAVAEVVTEALTTEIQRRGVAIISFKDVQTQMGFERQRQLMGCAETSACAAEIGAALGVDALVSG